MPAAPLAMLVHFRIIKIEQKQTGATKIRLYTDGGPVGAGPLVSERAVVRHEAQVHVPAARRAGAARRRGTTVGRGYRAWNTLRDMLYHLHWL